MEGTSALIWTELFTIDCECSEKEWIVRIEIDVGTRSNELDKISVRVVGEEWKVSCQVGDECAVGLFFFDGKIERKFLERLDKRRTEENEEQNQSEVG